MGRDGAAGTQYVKSHRGHTIAQDAETSVVFGMPKAAIDLGVVDQVLPITEVAKNLVGLVAPAS